MRITPIHRAAARIYRLVQTNRQQGNSLGNVYCCLEAAFVRAGWGDAMQFQTAVRFARAKGWLA